MAQIRLLIDSVDRTGNLLAPPDGEWEIEQQAFGEIDSASFVLDDPTNALTLNGGKEVIIENFSDDTVRYFGGTLTEATAYTYGVGRRFQCRALGWLFDLSRTIVSQRFSNRSDQYIITNATEGIFYGISGSTVQKDLSAYTVNTTNVEQGIPDTQIMLFRGESVRDVMDTLAGMANFVWGVTPLQVVYYRPYAAGLNTQSLSDDPDEVTSFPYYSFRYFKNFSGVVNSIYIFGGNQTVPDRTRVYRGDGVQTDFPVVHRWRAPAGEDRVTVEVNTGTDMSPVWTAQTVGFLQDPDEGSFDVLWYELGRGFFFAVAPPNLTNSWRVIGSEVEPVVWEDANQTSINAIGRYEATIKDSTILDEDHAERRAVIELLKRGSEAGRITLIRNFPVQADFPDHVNPWDGSNYKTESRTRQPPSNLLNRPTFVAKPPRYRAPKCRIPSPGPSRSVGGDHLSWTTP
jgi:hypothetical protein